MGKIIKQEQAIASLCDKQFLDKLYGFAYCRCSTTQDAEDLSAEIVLRILAQIRKQREEIRNFYAFAWTIARRTYADDLAMRKKRNAEILYDDSQATVSLPFAAQHACASSSTACEEQDRKAIEWIQREIVYLAKNYRDVFVLRYFDGLSTRQIAQRLSISETCVKQRLFCARNAIRKGEHTMTTNPVLHPIQIDFIGTGDPVGNDPSRKAERFLSQLLVYHCRRAARTAKELSELLAVPMPFIEDELEIQCRGENGSYGLLRKTGRDRYISNFLLLDVQDWRKAFETFGTHVGEFCSFLQKTVRDRKDELLAFPYLSPQTDIKFILWSLLLSSVNELNQKVFDSLMQTEWKDRQFPARSFSQIGIARKTEDAADNLYFYGNDGTVANGMLGYSHIFVCNIYGKRMKKHFSCGHNIAIDSELLLTVRSIGGLSAENLSLDEKETAAKAIEHGYIRRNGSQIEPRILVIDQKDFSSFQELLSDRNGSLNQLVQTISASVAALADTLVPAHLRDEYPLFAQMASTGFLGKVIEFGIQNNLLTVPDQLFCAEGVLLSVEREN